MREQGRNLTNCHCIEKLVLCCFGAPLRGGLQTVCEDSLMSPAKTSRIELITAQVALGLYLIHDLEDSS